MRQSIARIIFIPLIVLALLLAGARPSADAQAMTKSQGDAILKELRAIRQLLERQPSGAPRGDQPPDDRVTMPMAAGDFSLGRSDAPLTMVEYTDYQCPFCQRFHLDAFENIKKNYIDTGKLRYVSRDFPLDMHEHAKSAAQAARCAAEQNRFWELRHAMIANAENLKPENILAYAGDLKLDVASFKGCLESGKYQDAVEDNMLEGRRAGVSGTPSFVLGRVVKGNLNGVRIEGAMPYSTFAAKLEELLKQKPAK